MSNRWATLTVHPNRLICDIMARDLPLMSMELDAENQEFRFCPIFSTDAEDIIVPVNALTSLVVDCAIARGFEAHLGSKWDVMAEE